MARPTYPPPKPYSYPPPKPLLLPSSEPSSMASSEPGAMGGDQLKPSSEASSDSNPAPPANQVPWSVINGELVAIISDPETPLEWFNLLFTVTPPPG